MERNIMNLLNRPKLLSLEEVLPLSNNPDLQQKYKIIEGNLLGNLRLGLLLQDLDILAGKTAKLYIDQFIKTQGLSLQQLTISLLEIFSGQISILS